VDVTLGPGIDVAVSPAPVAEEAKVEAPQAPAAKEKKAPKESKTPKKGKAK
jgi:hypothetical protein